MNGEPREHIVHVRGIDLALWEWPGAGPTVLFCHATGFHARIWDQVIAGLGGLRAYAIDFRGHGRSSKPAPPYAWHDFGLDLAALAEAVGIEGAIGCGHSMGGHAATLAAAIRPQTFRRLVLIDPVIRAREAYIGPWVEEHFAAKRRNQWTSWQEMYERFRPREPFSLWDHAVLRDYCRYALIENGNGFALACPPAVEASIYQASTSPESSIHDQIPRVHVPVLVARAGRQARPGVVDMAASLTPPALASWFPNGRDLLFENMSHFIPMEQPSLCAQLVKAESATLGV